MAAEGLRFTNFYAASSVCSPSRAALMTGGYPQRVGLHYGMDFCVLLPGDPIGLSPETFSLPRLLKNAGYATKMIGKWHLGDQPEFLPNRHGFDSYFGLPYSNDMLPEYHLDGRFHFPPLPLMKNEEVVEVDPNQAALTDRYTAEAIRFIEQSARGDAPFFLYFAHMYVHVPIHTPMKYQVESRNGIYGAAVAHLDQSVGCLLESLDRLGIAENTLVIFTSDNGSNGMDGGSNAPLRGRKGSTWEGGMREPCIMRWPGTIPPGGTSSELATTMDILPTIARLISAEIPEDHTVDGRDISDTLLGESVAPRHDRPFHYYGRDRQLQAIRLGKWKLHLLRNELYDLDQDIGEQLNLAESHPEIVGRLSALAQACRAELGEGETLGTGCKPAARVPSPRTLTSLVQMDPLIRAMYDLDDAEEVARKVLL
jgi:arylsulfatase A-like enzyme